MKLEVDGVGKLFQRGKKEIQAVKNVSLTVSEGEFVSIIGHSGSGKSTLLNLISGQLLPTTGEILWNGESIVKKRDYEAAFLRNTLIGHIPQGMGLLSNLTVFDNLQLPFYLSKREGNPTERAYELLRRLGIENLKDSYPNSLSGGEMRRVSIARALINKPKILLADEPTSDLDPENTGIIIRLFQEISREGTGVLMVTHDLSTIGAADRVYQMSHGELVLKCKENITYFHDKEDAG